MKIQYQRLATVIVLLVMMVTIYSPLQCQCKSTKAKNNNSSVNNRKRTLKTSISKHKLKNVNKSGKKNKSNYSNNLPKCPKLSEFFTIKNSNNNNKNRRSDYKQKCKLTQCDVTIQKELCAYRTVPKKQHCLLLRNLINEMAPIYKPFLNRSKLSFFQNHGVKEIILNTCSKRIAFTTLQDGNFTIIPNGMLIFRYYLVHQKKITND